MLTCIPQVRQNADQHVKTHIKWMEMYIPRPSTLLHVGVIQPYSTVNSALEEKSLAVFVLHYL